jgi:hypothetical protein
VGFDLQKNYGSQLRSSTKYEKRGHRLGNSIWDFVLIKNPSPSYGMETALSLLSKQCVNELRNLYSNDELSKQDSEATRKYDP